MRLSAALQGLRAVAPAGLAGAVAAAVAVVGRGEPGAEDGVVRDAAVGVAVVGVAVVVVVVAEIRKLGVGVERLREADI